MKLSGLHTVVFMMVMMSMMMSCRDELCYNHYSSLDVSLSWEYEWERDYGLNHSANWDSSMHGFDYDDLRPGKPEWINLILFSSDGTRNETYMKEEKANVIINPEKGQSMLLYNADTEYIVFQDIASISEARATPTSRTRSTISYIMMQHPGLSTTNPPDNLYSAFIEDLPFVDTHQAVELPIKLQPLVFTYVIRYEFEYGLQHVVQARGALGGMAESVYLRDSRTSDEATIILFDCDLKDYGCESRVRSFGIPGFPDEYYGRAEGTTSSRPYTLNLEVLLKNGKTVEFNFNVADQMKKQPKGGVITVSGIRIEDEQDKPSESTGGFDVDLSGWDNVNLDFPLEQDKDNNNE